MRGVLPETARDSAALDEQIGLAWHALAVLVGQGPNAADGLTPTLVLWIHSRFNTQADVTTLLIPTFIQGIAMAFFFVPLMTLILSGLPPERIPAASGLSNFTRITTGAFATSIATTLWDNGAATHHAQLAEFVNGTGLATNEALAASSASGMTHKKGLALINRVVDQQAFMMSANDIFSASAVIFLVLVGIIWLARPTPRARRSMRVARTDRWRFKLCPKRSIESLYNERKRRKRS